MVMDNPNGGYAKDDVKRFVTEFLLPEFDPSRDEALWRTLIENACTEVNIKISKNMRESLTQFIVNVLNKLLDHYQTKLGSS